MDIIVAYAVGERSQEDGWKKLVEMVCNTPDHLPVLNEMERQYKEAFDKPLPSAYRSAKSTVLAAVRHGVRLINEDGTVRGKTAVSKDFPKKDKTFDVGVWVKKLNDELDKMDGLTAKAWVNYVRVNVRDV